MSPEDIAALLQAEGSGSSADDHDEATQPDGARQRRIELLQPVLSACQQAWLTGSEQLDYIAEKLADGSRDVAWRGPFGDSGILDFFLGALAANSLRQFLLVHSLRLVGNSCADTDENRARVVQGNHLASIIRHVQDESLVAFTVPVLFNIMVDYEPAQLLASQSHLNQHLTDLLASPIIFAYAPFVPYFCKILVFLAEQDGETDVANPLTVDLALTLATSDPFNDDLDDFMSLLTAATAYLAKESFQSALVASGPGTTRFLTAFHHAHAAFDPQRVDDPESSVELRRLRTALLTALADLTGHDAFFAAHPFASPATQQLWAWLHTPDTPLQAAACIALGNMSRSDAASAALVHDHAAHVPLATLLSDPAVADAQLLHAALSFLKNLAIPPANKPQLAALLAPPCLPRIYSLDALPQVQFAAVSLSRLLLAGCAPNVSRFCAPRSDDPASPAHDRTSLHALIALFDRSDAEPTRLEAARAAAAICRVFHSAADAPDMVLPDWVPSRDDDAAAAEHPAERWSDADDEPGRRRGIFYKRHDHLAQMLSLLVTQTKWPSVRSEAWFVLALMCRSRDGGGLMLTVMQAHAAVDALTRAVVGEDGRLPEGAATTTTAAEEPEEQNPEHQQQQQRAAAPATERLELEPQEVDPAQKAGMAKVDRENALVLCTELLRNWGDDLPPPRASMLQDLVRAGTELVAAEKAAG